MVETVTMLLQAGQTRRGCQLQNAEANKYRDIRKIRKISYRVAF